MKAKAYQSTQGVSMNSPHYRIIETVMGFYFELILGNGELLVRSSAYQTKFGCLNGIETLRRRAKAAELSDGR